jgi:asparagine synthase (glutamine-hydrolysing)
MCGIAGYLDFKGQLEETLLRNMVDCLQHRGPDDSGIYKSGKVGIGQSRLSIIDLTTTGHQPMHTSDKKVSIVFNGEIYNHVEIRQSLIELGYEYRGTSDTESILFGYMEWGSNIFEKLNGIFTIAIIDDRSGELILARDRFGVKPLYYFLNDECLLFSSEIKSILEGGIQRKINYQGLAEFLYYGYAMGMNTMFDSIYKVMPGQIFKINTTTSEIKKEFFWLPEKNISLKNSYTEKEAITTTRELLEQAVRRQLISDVPVGVFLSGGIDSSSITAFASKHYDQKINTFSAGFDFDNGHNELPLAEKIAKKYNTNHHTIMIEGKSIPDIIKKMVIHHDEPFSDAANIPLYLLTKSVKDTCTVILQGDGGDELFAGYPRYHILQQLYKYKYPIILLDKISGLLPNGSLKRKANRFASVFSEKTKGRMFAKLLTVQTEERSPNRTLSRLFQSRIQDKNPFMRYEEVYDRFKHLKGLPQQMLWIDTQIILPDQFLEKVDKSTMANSVEVRVPFLDNDLSEFAMSLPGAMKVRGGVKKYILKKALEGIVDDEVLYGPKKGFGVPYQNWIEKPINDFFWDSIKSKYIQDLGILDYDYIDQLTKPEHGGFAENGFMLWKILNLCIWLEAYKIEV